MPSLTPICADIYITGGIGTGAVEAMRVNGRLFRVGVIYSACDLIKEYGLFRLLPQIGQTVAEIQELHRPGHGHKA